MTLRRHSVDAGSSWRKFTDPAIIAEQQYERRERRINVSAFLAYCVAVGSWAGIVVMALR